MHRVAARAHLRDHRGAAFGQPAELLGRQLDPGRRRPCPQRGLDPLLDRPGALAFVEATAQSLVEPAEHLGLRDPDRHVAAREAGHQRVGIEPGGGREPLHQLLPRCTRRRDGHDVDAVPGHRRLPGVQDAYQVLAQPERRAGAGRTVARLAYGSDELRPGPGLPLGELALPGGADHLSQVAGGHHDVHLRGRKGLHGAAGLALAGTGEELLGDHHPRSRPAGGLRRQLLPGAGHLRLVGAVQPTPGQVPDRVALRVLGRSGHQHPALGELVAAQPEHVLHVRGAGPRQPDVQVNVGGVPRPSRRLVRGHGRPPPGVCRFRTAAGWGRRGRAARRSRR